jgi:phenylalanyl-tRNA synthetase alpha chain
VEERIGQLGTEARGRIEGAADAEALKTIERELLGKQGVLAEVLASIPGLEPAERPLVGRLANELKCELLGSLAARREALDQERLATDRACDDFDPTLPARRAVRGSLHPITRVRRKVEDVFTSMGYSILEGPQVELDYYNFQALNIPADHPAREMQDTFYCTGGGNLVMRTHTSPVQVRTMERAEPPYRVVSVGRVFRKEEQDATHDHTFHQVEGLVVGEDVTAGHLIGTLRALLARLFGRELDTRLRPGYFPFVEPGFELDVRCPFCEDGCRVCSRTTWIEFCGLGMVHPRVFAASDVDAERYTGFAFGFGLDRLTMMLLGIDDVRHFMAGDLRFLEQF